PLLAHLGFQTTALVCDLRDEKPDDEIASKTDDSANDLDMQGVGIRPEDVLQDSTERGQADGDGQAVDQRAEGNGQHVEVAERIILDDDPVGIGDGGNSESNDDVQQSRCAVLFGSGKPLVVVAVFVSL